MATDIEKARARLEELLRTRPGDVEATFERSALAAADLFVFDMQCGAELRQSQARFVNAISALRAVRQALGKPTLPPEPEGK